MRNSVSMHNNNTTDSLVCIYFARMVSGLGQPLFSQISMKKQMHFSLTSTVCVHG